MVEGDCQLSADDLDVAVVGMGEDKTLERFRAVWAAMSSYWKNK
jgi:hypothetical protein